MAAGSQRQALTLPCSIGERPEAKVAHTEPLPICALDVTRPHEPRSARPASTGISPAAISSRTNDGSAASSATSSVGVTDASAWASPRGRSGAVMDASARLRHEAGAVRPRGRAP